MNLWSIVSPLLNNNYQIKTKILQSIKPKKIETKQSLSRRRGWGCLQNFYAANFLPKNIGTASARTSGASNASGRRAHHPRHHKEEEKKEKKTPPAPNQLPTRPAHRRLFLVRSLPTNSPLRHSPARRTALRPFPMQGVRAPPHEHGIRPAPRLVSP